MRRRINDPLRRLAPRADPGDRRDRPDDGRGLCRTPRLEPRQLARGRASDRGHGRADRRAVARRADLRRDHRRRSVRFVRQGDHLPRGRGRDHRRPRLVRARRRACIRICGPDHVQRGGHERDGLGDQPDFALCRARADQPRELRAGRLPPDRRAVGRGGPQIFRPRRAGERDPALRHFPAVRLHRHDELHRPGRGIRARSAVARAAVRPRIPARRPGLQDQRGAVPHVDARRLRRRADAGDRCSSRRRQRSPRSCWRRGSASTRSVRRPMRGARS